MIQISQVFQIGPIKVSIISSKSELPMQIHRARYNFRYVQLGTNDKARYSYFRKIQLDIHQTKYNVGKVRSDLQRSWDNFVIPYLVTDNFATRLAVPKHLTGHPIKLTGLGITWHSETTTSPQVLVNPKYDKLTTISCIFFISNFVALSISWYYELSYPYLGIKYWSP